MKYELRTEPTQEEMRYYIRKQICWICGEGSFKSLPSHTVRTHGITALDIRNMAGMLKSESIVSEELSDKQRESILGKLGDKRWLKGGTKCPIFSDRGDKLHRENAKKYLVPLKIPEKQRKPHNCPVCNKFIPKSLPKYCSPECVAVSVGNKMRERDNDNWSKYRDGKKHMWVNRYGGDVR